MTDFLHSDFIRTLLYDAIEKGLERADPAIVRLVKEHLEQSDAAEDFQLRSIEIVPYTIADTSLKSIVLKAPEYVIDEIEEALRVRKTLEGKTEDGEDSSKAD